MLRVASWNVHGFVGSDGCSDPGRCLEVVERLDVDVVALQEVSGTGWEPRAESLGYHVIRGLTRIEFGNALLVRVPAAGVARHALSLPGREERGALIAVLDTPIGPLRVATTHLGLKISERRRQAARLARILQSEPTPEPTVLVGDFNDWTPWAGQLGALERAVGPLSRLATFPSRRPVLALDRGAWSGDRLDGSIRVVRSLAARLASDHLPLRIELARAAPAGTAMLRRASSGREDRRT